ncbi:MULTISPECIES: Pycsar system effector family protein [unclassified Streptomyces]|uniref:Pycsar system effector family protein n=1 Tax=unclassified Streptomyces TaxID=2593676 RepID=UPI0035DF52C0
MSTDELNAAHAEANAAITRTDTKTGLLLAFVGAVMAGAWTTAKDLPLTLPAYIVGGAGLTLLLVAAGLLLQSVRPRLGGGGGFPLWATLTPQQLATTTETRDLAADTVALSRIAVAKFVLLQRAVDLVLAAGALLLVAALIVLGGAL